MTRLAARRSPNRHVEQREHGDILVAHASEHVRRVGRVVKPLVIPVEGRFAAKPLFAAEGGVDETQHVRSRLRVLQRIGEGDER